MVASPEREHLPVEDRAEEFPEIPITVENKGVVVPTPSQFKAQVMDDSGKGLIGTPSTEPVTIELPGEKEQLSALSKGTPDEAITWFAAFWIRVFKKAVHFGWRVVTGRREQSAA